MWHLNFFLSVFKHDDITEARDFKVFFVWVDNSRKSIAVLRKCHVSARIKNQVALFAFRIAYVVAFGLASHSQLFKKFHHIKVIGRTLSFVLAVVVFASVHTPIALSIKRFVCFTQFICIHFCGAVSHQILDETNATCNGCNKFELSELCLGFFSVDLCMCVFYPFFAFNSWFSIRHSLVMWM